MVSNKISQRDIAERAKVHFTTVSLALRNSATLPETTRVRIQNLAKEMGYRPDPMLSALQAYRKNVKTAAYEGTIAWINTHTPPQRLYAMGAHIVAYRAGALRRCEELGYRLEDFQLMGMTSARLSRIFQTRNIQGLLLPPQPRNRCRFKLDWENYSAVSFGSTLSWPQLHVVTSAQYRASRIAARQLLSYGYRRIGFVTTHNSDERTDQNFSAGFSVEQRRLKPKDQIPMLILEDQPAPLEKKDFARWYKSFRPDVILSQYYRIPYYMEELGISPVECGLALLARNSDSDEFAGIDQNDFQIGYHAVDFLVGMMHRNERGIPATPLRLLIEGKWVNGRSVARQNFKEKIFKRPDRSVREILQAA